eukprot:CAMPEP_0119169578 /NCGR_PEP_ID=MMETSP1315-20130426/11200_1 /TAXON_ID=676789 /ORGANISM="Prasinoderma singularis, Strain RCC927" /LENGTH=33 /DNA_ID= /DNA_START= /DNA_END= /DNA_ORIENTATION=
MAVVPFASCASLSAPASSNSLTVPAWLDRAARM